MFFYSAEGGNGNRAKQKCLVLGFPGLPFFFLTPKNPQNMLEIWPQNILNLEIGSVSIEMFQVLHDQYNATAWIHDGKLSIVK